MRRIFCLNAVFASAIVGLLAAAFGLAFADTEEQPSPPLGINGTLIPLADRVVPAPSDLPNRGIRVNRVYPDTPAARLGLEPGDIIVSIDSMRFTSYVGYRHALACSGHRASFVIVDMRTGRLIRRSVEFAHRRPDDAWCEPHPPDTYLMSIDFR